MILLLTLDDELFRCDPFLDAIETVFPFPQRTYFNAGDVHDGKLVDVLTRFGFTFGDITVRHTDKLFDAVTLFTSEMTANPRTARTLRYIAAEVTSFAEGSRVVTALMNIHPELVLGFEYKEGSVPEERNPAMQFTGFRVLNLKGGFPSEVAAAG